MPVGRPRDGYGGVRKRAKTEGFHGKKLWVATFYDAEGRRRESVASTKAEALRIFRERTGEAAQGKKFSKRSARSPRLSDFFLKTYLPAHGHQADARGKTYRARSWAESAIGGLRLDKIKTSQVDRIVSGWRRAGSTPATVNRKIQLLRHAMRYATEDGLLSEADNFAAKLKTLREHNQRIRFLTQEEELGLFNHLPTRYHHLVVLALHTGMRRGEQWSIRRQDVNFEARTIRIQVSKGGVARDVPLTGDAYGILEELCTDVPAPGYLLARDTHGHQTGTFAPNGAHNFVNRWFVPALQAAGVSDFRWHDLRHTFATRFLEVGGSIIELQRILGHSQLNTTMRYAHTRQDRIQSVMDKLGTANSEFMRKKCGKNSKLEFAKD